jgi:response regulator RpfG family c-di-GMP phosphodiesterase
MQTLTLSRDLRDRAQIPLWVILSFPFIVLIISVVALTGYLSLQNSEDAVDDLAVRLLAENSGRIEHRVQSFLDVPRVINQTTANDTLRQDPATAAIPFVFMTAKTNVDDLERVQVMMGEGYLIKPFTIDELLMIIQRHTSDDAQK